MNRKEKQTHQVMFIQCGPTMTYSREEIDLSNPLSMSFCRKRYKRV